MKRILVFLSVLLFQFPFRESRAEFLLQPNDTLAICGDSITEQKLYSVFIEDYLLMCQPTEGLRIAQFGWGGEQVPDFLKRLQSDVFPFKPTVATLCYGMNDGHYRAMEQTAGDTYRKGLTDSIEALKKSGVRTVLVGSPGVVDPLIYHNGDAAGAAVYNQTLGALRDIAQQVAAQEGVSFTDVHQPMSDVMEKAKAAYGKDYAFVAGGGIHPNENGHLVMAYAFLKGLGCDGAIGTITVDLASGTAQGTPGQKIVSASGGTIEVESTRWPFCVRGDPTKPDQTSAAIVRFTPFYQELDRYMLMVNGLTTANAKVTWGTQSKNFTAAQLSQGINLAEEFSENPFSQPFAKVDQLVRDQQAFETVLVKTYLHVMTQFKTFAGPDADALDRIAASGVARDKELFTAANAAVTPVDYTLHIEAVP